MERRWTLLGHSERRSKYGETDEDVAEKVSQALGAGLKATSETRWAFFSWFSMFFVMKFDEIP